jgi:hypothetical protein
MMDYNRLLKEREQAFIADRIYISQWCEKLIAAYDELTPEMKAALPLSGRKAEELLPSLFKEPFDPEQYDKEAAILQRIQQEAAKQAMVLNAEAERCLSK